MIHQIFHLSKDLTEKIEKSEKPSNYQSKIDLAVKTVNEKCKLDFIDFEQIESIAVQIQSSYKKAIIIGMGGASSASRAFTAAQNYESENFELIYSDSLSLQKQAAIFSKKNLETSAIIIISRSGDSIETISQTNAIIDRYYQYFGQDYLLGKHFFIITQGENKLSKIAKPINAKLINYECDSGKFASFSMVGLLPARLINLDPKEIVVGAKHVLDQPLNSIESANINYHLLNHNYSINVMVYYNDLLDQMSFWHSQIASEIIAKDGKGFTPITARGVFDQHGLWQLLLAGRHDKYFTFLCNKSEHEDNQINIQHMYHKLTKERLKRSGLPFRELIIDSLSDLNLGSLSMQFLLELVILANFLEISPLSQPFIDENKRIMSYLTSNLIQNN